MKTNISNQEELQKKYSDLQETSNARVKTVLLWNIITFFLIPGLFFLPSILPIEWSVVILISSALFVINIAIMFVAFAFEKENTRNARYAIEQNTTLELAKKERTLQRKQDSFWLFRLPKYWRYSLIAILIVIIIVGLLSPIFCSFYNDMTSSKTNMIYLICNDRFVNILSKITYILAFILFFRIPKFK